MDDEKNMSFLDHLEELRWRLVRISVAIVTFACVLFYFQEWIMNAIFLNMKNPSFITFRLMCHWFGVCIEEIPVSFQSTTMSGQFSYALILQVSLVSMPMTCVWWWTLMVSTDTMMKHR